MFKKLDVNFKTIAANSFAIFFGFTVWRVLFNNYGKEVFDISAYQIGIIQSVREIPGLLGFGSGMLALVLAESKIAALNIIILGGGLLMVGWAENLWMMGVGTFISSVGFHYFLSSNKSQLLNLIKRRNSGREQGKLMSIESISAVAATLAVLGLTLFLSYRVTFTIIGSAVTLFGIYFVFAIKSNRVEGERRRAIVKKKYWLYYTLAFLRGSRRHIFTTFAIFLLVANHGLSITAISTLLLINSILIIFTSRLIGNLTDSMGERFILVGTSFILFFIFLGYTYVTYLPVLIGCFILDHILFGSSIALNSYLRKISDREDLTGNLSFGLTANHISAVFIPIIGGAMWELFGYETTFLFGTVIVFLDMLFAMRINPDKFDDAQKKVSDKEIIAKT
ncbi:MAG: MFS transporter [candidate division Zixibacteria bacterium]|nr:MFS transporter [candidate division Zixibacteria bacterium]